jgi:hypothetical protein
MRKASPSNHGGGLDKTMKQQYVSLLYEIRRAFAESDVIAVIMLVRKFARMAIQDPDIPEAKRRHAAQLMMQTGDVSAETLEKAYGTGYESKEKLHDDSN